MGFLCKLHNMIEIHHMKFCFKISDVFWQLQLRIGMSQQSILQSMTEA